MEPMQKKLIGVGVAATVLVGAVLVMMFRGGEQVAAPSTASVGGPDASGQDAGKTNHSPYYQSQLDQYNREQAELAARAGRTSVALLNPTEVSSGPFQPQAQHAGPQQQARPQVANYDEARAQAKAQFFLQIMNDEKGGEVMVSRLTVPQAQTAAANASNGGATTTNDAAQKAQARKLISGGYTVTATFDHAIDTDVPGDMFLTIRGGDFDGAQLHGSIKRVGNYIHAPVETMYWRGNTYAVKAVAMDPDTGRAVLSGEVDNKWMERFGWPFLVAALNGAATIASQPPQTAIISNGGAAVANAEPQSKQILGGAVAAGTSGIAQALAAEGQVEKAVRRPADAVVVRFLTEVIEK